MPVRSANRSMSSYLQGEASVLNPCAHSAHGKQEFLIYRCHFKMMMQSLKSILSVAPLSKLFGGGSGDVVVGFSARGFILVWISLYAIAAAVLCTYVDSMPGLSGSDVEMAAVQLGIAGMMAFLTCAVTSISQAYITCDDSAAEATLLPLATCLIGFGNSATMALRWAPVISSPSSDGPVYPMRYLTWCFSTTCMIISIWRCSSLGRSKLIGALAFDWLMLITGFIADVSPRPSMQVWLCASFACFIYQGHLQLQMMSDIIQAYNNLPGAQTSVRRLRSLLAVVWNAFGIFFFLQKLDVASPIVFDSLIVFSDVFAKCCLSGAIVHGVLSPVYAARRGIVRLEEVAREFDLQMEESRNRDKRKDFFFSALAHELKTPLNAIIGLTDSLLSSSNDSQFKSLQHGILDTIRATSWRLSKLVGNILDNSSTPAHEEIVLAAEEISMSKMAQTLAMLAAPLLTADTLFCVDIPRDIAPVVADSARLMQILINVVGNAAKYTTKGSVTLSCRCREHEAVITVADTGCGIDPELVSSLFAAPCEPSACTGDISQHDGHTGLGLYNAKKLVQAHSGTIKAKSTVGTGTTVTIVLPQPGSELDDEGQAPLQDMARRLSGLSASSSIHKAVVIPNPSTPPFYVRNGSANDLASWFQSAEVSQWSNGENIALSTDEYEAPESIEILSVDDVAGNHMVIEQLAGSCIFKFSTANTAEQALELLEQRDQHGGISGFPDIILMEFNLPDMSGPECVRTIRRRYPLSGVPIIMASDMSDEKSILEGLKCGSNDSVTKPFKRTELLARIGVHIRVLRYHQRLLEARLNEQILHGILPQAVAERIKSGDSLISEELDNVTVLFSDIVGFTELAAAVSTPRVIGMLDQLFASFDIMLMKHDVYKVETIGDAYMIVSGHDKKSADDHAHRMLRVAEEMIAIASSMTTPLGTPLRIRVGVHSGPAYAGVVGRTRPRYCLFGDTVNTASRMESNGFPMCVHLSNSTYQLVRNSEFEFLHLPVREIKGKGPMKTLLLRAGDWQNGFDSAVRFCASSPDGSASSSNERLPSVPWLSKRDADFAPAKASSLKAGTSSDTDADGNYSSRLTSMPSSSGNTTSTNSSDSFLWPASWAGRDADCEGRAFDGHVRTESSITLPQGATSGLRQRLFTWQSRKTLDNDSAEDMDFFCENS